MKIKEYITIKTIVDNFEEKEVDKELLKMFPNMKLKEATSKLLEYYEYLNNSTNEVVNTFTYKGVKYGLIPDLENIKTKEYLDIEMYETNVQNIHRLLAVLYRPITKEFGDKYEIEEYDTSDKYKDVMLEVDAIIYKNVIGFFLTLKEILLKDTLTSISKKRT